TTDLPQEGQLYKFLIEQADGRKVMKIDPFAICFEKRPGTAAVVYNLQQKKWQDGLWRGRQKRMHSLKRPLNVYEVHASSWKQHEDGRPYSFADLTVELIPYVKEMGYTHIEFLPLMEHPLGTSWGYQPTGFFALASYYGTPEELRDFVDCCHLNNIGVFVYWVPAHFCINDDALAYYDGTATFDYSTSAQAHNIRLVTIGFDLGISQVQNCLNCSALFWMELFQLACLRVDALYLCLFLKYHDGPLQANFEGGNRNYE